MLTQNTKIVCTIGPGTETPAILKKLMQHGMTIARFNFSHGEYAWFHTVIGHVKKIREELGLPCSIMLDTKGPEIRTSKTITRIEIRENAEYSMGPEKSGADIEVDYADIVAHCKKGQLIQMDGGLLRMTVVGKKGKNLLVKAHGNHVLTSKRHVNLPGVHLSLPILSKKDKEDIAFGIKEGIEMISASFINKKEDILTIRKEVKKLTNRSIPIIAKIESEIGLHNIDEILEVCDGIMIARGDLCVEIPFEKIPVVQRMLVEKAILAKKPVIMATQMLASMVNNSSPTRAEITDIGNAIFLQVDAIMLSEETSVGKFPVECLNVMTKIAKEIAPTLRNTLGSFTAHANEQEFTLIKSGVEIAESVGASAIVLMTEHQDLLCDLALLRPKVPIYLFSKDTSLLAYANLLRNVQPFLLSKTKHHSAPDRVVGIVQELKSGKYIHLGQKAIFFFDLLEKDHRLDTVQIKII